MEKKNNRFTPLEKHKIMDLKSQGYGYKAIATRLFLEGKTPSGIARYLTEQQIPTPGGKTKWQSGTVLSILTNEKYKRDREARRLQTNHFMRELKKQEGIITEFDEVLWYTLVDRITVYNETDIRFAFKDGTEYKV